VAAWNDRKRSEPSSAFGRTVEVNSYVTGMLAVALVATEVNIVCGHVVCRITTMQSYNVTIVKIGVSRDLMCRRSTSPAPAASIWRKLRKYL
jgi:hypothetical protein